MKVILLAVAALAVASALPQNRAVTYDLASDLQEFVNMIPVDEIASVFLDYLSSDAEVIAAVEYAQTPEFHSIVKSIDELPAYLKFLNAIQAKGVDIYEMVNLFHDFIGMPRIKVPSSKKSAKGTGLRGLLDEIEALIPFEELEVLFNKKYEESKDFKFLIDYLKSDEFFGIVKSLTENPEFKNLLEKVRGRIDLDALQEFLEKFFGWIFPKP